MSETSPGAGRGRAIAVAFFASILGSIGVTIVYALGGQPQLEGLLLSFALGGIAFGLVLWSRSLMPNDELVEDRVLEPGEADPADAAEEAFAAGAAAIARRTFLGRILAAAGVALGGAAIFPIRSLGQRPGDSLLRTHWRAGVHLVTADGRRVGRDDVAPNGVLTVFPEGRTDAADSQVVLIRLPEGVSIEGVVPTDGFVGFSKICTHAGCPVGLYQAETQELFCPCHQSVFAVRRGARPTSGPATRRLPRLPLRIVDDKLVAAGDFSEPVGPGFWGMP